MSKKALPLLIIFVSSMSALLVIISLRLGCHTQPPVSAPEEINRIVSLAPNITEILFALGIGDKVVAVSSACDYPPDVYKLKKIGAFMQPNTEAVIASKPDLVITLSFEQHRQLAQSLKRLGYNTLVLKIDKIDQLMSAIMQIGQKTGTEETAAALSETLQQKIREFKQKLSSLPKVKVIWVIEPKSLRVAGRDTFINQLVEISNGENFIPETITKYPQVAPEQLVGSDADVIIHSAMSKNIEKERENALEFWQKFPNIPAVKNKRIYVINPDKVLRLGPRLPDGLEQIGRCLHPQLYEESN